MTSLSEIRGLNQYCGPAVLAALTGRSTDACAAVISAVSGKNVIKAVQIPHLLEACRRLDFVTQEVKLFASTLFSVISSLVNKDGFYIILVPGHVVALEIRDKQAYFIDNHTKSPIPAAASARLTQRVEKAWKVVAKPVPSREEISEKRIAFLKEEIKKLTEQIKIKEELKKAYEAEFLALLTERRAGDEEN